MTKDSRKLSCFLGCVLLLATHHAFAQAVISSDRYFTERLRGGRDIVALDPDNMFGDAISLKDGGVEFSQDDVVVPLNSGLRLAFSRQTPKHLLGLDFASMPLGAGWELNVPYMVGRYDNRRGWDARGGGRCSGSNLSPTEWVGPSPDYNTRVQPAYMYWSGIHINIPGVGFETLLTPTAQNSMPNDGVTYIGTTRGDWRASCLAALKMGAGEGFVVRLPNGQKYYFDWMASRDTPDVLANPYYHDALGNGTAPPYLLVPTSDYFLYATKVEDRFGNYILYNYDGTSLHQLKSIVSNEGARIDIEYDANGKVSYVKSGDRTWSYRYVDAVLSEVELPDHSKWTFSGDKLLWKVVATELPGGFYANDCAQNAAGFRQSDPEPAGYGKTFLIQHPSGAVGEFRFRGLIHGSDNAPGGCGIFGTSSSDFYFGSYGIPNAYLAFSLISKKITGVGGVNQIWGYLYSPNWSFAKDCSGGCYSTTTVTGPSGTTTIYQFGNSYTDNLGELISERVTLGGVVKKTTSYMRKGSTGDFAMFYGALISGTQDNPFKYKVRPIQTTEQVIDGMKYRRTVSAFDQLARPTNIVKSSTPSP